MDYRSTKKLASSGLVLLLVSFAACAPEPLGFRENSDSEFSPIRYKDRDLVSLNTKCPVTDDPLNTAIEPVYVNGQPIGFC